MKKNNILKVVTLSLTILLIWFISFGGIFVNKNNAITDITPDYLTDMNLRGTREITFNVDESTKQVTYDSEGNVVENTDQTTEESTQNTNTTVDEPVNKPEMLTAENYKTSKEIFEARLKTIGATQYEIRLNEESGKIVLKVPEDKNTDNIIKSINGVGSFEMIDAETKEVLLDNSYLKTVKPMYGSTESDTVVYVTFVFNKEGKAKLEELTKIYVTSEDAEGNKTEKKATLQIDGTDIISSTFENPITSGELSLTLNSSIKSSSEAQSYLQQAIGIAALVDNGKMPVQYKIEDAKFVSSNMVQYNENLIYLIGIVVFTIMLVYIVIRYKEAGVLSAISNIGFLSALLLIIRYVNVVISLEGIASIIFVIILNYILTIQILKGQSSNSTDVAFKKEMIKFLLISIPLWIIAIVFTVINVTVTQSFGMILFWGLLLIVIYNYIFTKNLLSNVNSKIKLKDRKTKKVQVLKIALIISAVIIVAGTITIIALGMNKEAQYKQAYSIELPLQKEFDIQDIKQITDEVFGNQKVLIQYVEYFKDIALITTENITDEQKAQLVEKINNKYELEYTTDSIKVNEVPGLRLRDLVKPYIKPMLIASLIILVYMMIRFYKLNVFKVFITTGLTMIIPLAVYVNLISITRLPIMRLVLPIAVFIYTLAILVLSQNYEKKAELSINKKRKVK